MEVEEKFFCSGGRQAWRSSFRGNTAVYKHKCRKLNTESDSELQLSGADHAIREHIERTNGKRERKENASMYKLKKPKKQTRPTQPSPKCTSPPPPKPEKKLRVDEKLSPIACKKRWGKRSSKKACG